MVYSYLKKKREIYISNIGLYFKTIICDKKDVCKTPESYCRTCLRNKANKYKDYFSVVGNIDNE